MTRRVFTDRSRILTHQRCARLRYLEYHAHGTGIVTARRPLAPSVGISTHVGLSELLRTGDETLAVAAALADFTAYAQKLDAAQDDAGADGPPIVPLEPRVREGFDAYLYAEQSALVEALVRAYARRRLRPLLEQFEVLEVEREGEWKLGEWGDDSTAPPNSWTRQTREINGEEVSALFPPAGAELWFLSRPDALLLDRESRQLYLLSYKTAASWDARKARDAEHDMQGLSEGIEIERRLAEWWRQAHGESTDADMEEFTSLAPGDAPVMKYLRDCPAPPRILGVRYEYLLKGERRLDKDLSAQLGMTVKSQGTSLVRPYYSAGMTDADAAWNAEWEYLKPDGTGTTSKLNYRTWSREPIWTHMTIREWISRLDDSAPLVSGDTGAELGIKSAAQATGLLLAHPLDACFPAPLVVHRNEDDLRDLVEQMEASERRVAESLVQVEAAADDGERRSLLNRHFPQSRGQCEYMFGSSCAMVPICYGGEDIRRDPLGSGRYVARVPNHPREGQGH